MLSREQTHGIGKRPEATVRSYGAVTHIDRFGTDLVMRSAAPPPAAEYQAWLESRNIGQHSGYTRHKWSGVQVRRCVIMRRNGSTWAACAQAIGLKSGGHIKRVLEFLPLDLQP